MPGVPDDDVPFNADVCGGVVAASPSGHEAARELASGSCLHGRRLVDRWLHWYVEAPAAGKFAS